MKDPCFETISSTIARRLSMSCGEEIPFLKLEVEEAVAVAAETANSATEMIVYLLEII
jgi:hypothetical protein